MTISIMLAAETIQEIREKALALYTSLGGSVPANVPAAPVVPAAAAPAATADENEDAPEAAQGEEKKRRGRPRRKDASAEAPSAPASAAPSVADDVDDAHSPEIAPKVVAPVSIFDEDETPEADAPAAPKIDYDTLMTTANKVINGKGMPRAVEILRDLGFKRISQVPEEKFAELHAAFVKELAA